MGRFKSKKFIIIAAVLLISAVAAYTIIRMNSQGAALEVEKLQVDKTRITSDVIISGTIRSGDEAEINSELEDAVKAVYVKEGERVSKGQMLAALETDVLRTRLDSARIDLDIADRELKDSVEGTALYRLEKDADSKRIEYESAKSDYEKTASLYDNGAVSKKELDDAQKRLASAKNSYDISLNDIQEEKSGSSRKIKEMQVEKQRLALELAQSQYDDAVLKSPVDGTVVYANCKVGIEARLQKPMFVVHNLDKLQVHANVSQFEIHKVRIGQEAIITGDAFPDSKLAGRISYIAPSALAEGTQTEKSVLVKLDIIDPPSGIKTGFSADVDIVTGEKEDALVVPYEALLLKSDGKHYVYKIEGGKLREIPIELGIEGDLKVEAISALLKAGDVLAANPDDSFKDGLKVMVKGEQK
ncbi:RND family efflux transporter, MFP subunit (plasmid) [Peptoclostridium acidaminophilum DSM 3953]|uniref:RND family efflux transporter, MFP subunit n=1 Tax=Peptoclostridium acidaminophilum DSM 3953 TaxID=1286171 RepID=W8TBI3_PEPAC|nr:efflux RND transporter periplasmic adaptor subunit [Peptoclostridium acidaminophilum]AHM58185.1 RND family efflux transporter, MFP subunit [Peptoclostridium acidaminophilum DSM 3953]